MPLLPGGLPPRLQQQLTFLLEIDRLKGVLRQSRLLHEERRENSAEHSWHLAMLALFLAEYADTSVDVARVVKLVLIHDLVEIDAGDTYCYDVEGQQDKAAREHQAATRLFGLLPADQADELWSLWSEFEAGETPEAAFASALDRLMPLLHNYGSGGAIWRQNGIHEQQVLARNAPIAMSSAILWELAQAIIEEAVERGFLPESPSTSVRGLRPRYR